MLEQRIDAVYEGGVLRPLNPLDLAEHAQVSLVIQHELPAGDAEPGSDYKSFFAETGNPTVTWEEVRKITAKLTEPLSDDVQREREDCC